MIGNEFDENKKNYFLKGKDSKHYQEWITENEVKREVEKVMREAIQANKMMVIVFLVMVGFLLGCIFGIYWVW